MEKHITTPITQKITKDLKSGDYVYITGEMYVARDAAHKRMIEALDRKEELPIDIRIRQSTIWDHHRPEMVVQLAQPDRQQQQEWTNMPQDCLI